MKKAFILLFASLFAIISYSQSIDGRRVIKLPYKTTIDTGDQLVIYERPIGKMKRTSRVNIAPNFASSTFTPTGAAVTNVATVTPTVGYYSRVGDAIRVWGEVTIDPSNTKAASELTLTLPIASDIGQTYELSGSAFSNDSTSIRILGNVSGDKASFKWYANDTTSKAYSYSYTYHLN